MVARRAVMAAVSGPGLKVPILRAGALRFRNRHPTRFAERGGCAGVPSEGSVPLASWETPALDSEKHVPCW